MVQFVNSFLSYLMLFLLIAVVAGCAIAIGIALRKRKNNRAAVEETDNDGAQQK